jgi:hypothetical protein
MGKNISVVSCRNAMETAVPYFVCLNSLLLFLKFLAFWKEDFSWPHYQQCAGNMVKSIPFRRNSFSGTHDKIQSPQHFLM